MASAKSVSRICKRLFDLLFASVMLLCALPILIIVALTLYATIGKPILFRQKRPGYKGIPFIIYKFRTMTDARDCQGQLLADTQRLTRFGTILRATSIDELPQLWNVVKGEMSLVGPRPLLMEYLNRYNSEQNRRHNVTPGITGWSQVNGRNALSWRQKLALDVWYVDHWSLWFDCKILLLTITSVVCRRGIKVSGDEKMPDFSEESGKRKQTTEAAPQPKGMKPQSHGEHRETQRKTEA